MFGIETHAKVIKLEEVNIKDVPADIPHGYALK